MKRILIADASKASLVMTSEVFKDHFPGVQVVVARTSADALELAKTCGELDAFIIDYDLPDRDGAYTAARLKKSFTQPILITAFDRPDVHETIERDLSGFDDCMSWLKKPVKPEIVVSLAQRFIEGKHRCQRRLTCNIPAFLEIEFVPTALHAATSKLPFGSSLQVARAKVKTKIKAKPANASKSSASRSGSTSKSASKQTSGAGHKANSKNPTPPASNKKTLTAQKSASKAPAKTASKTAPKAPAKTAANTAPKAAIKTPSKSASKASPKTSTLKAKVSPSQVSDQPVRKIIPLLIDDVSLDGIKVRIQNQELTYAVSGQTKNGTRMIEFIEGQVLQVHLPPSKAVEGGAESLEQWRKAKFKELTATLGKKTSGGQAKSNAPATTLNALAERTRKALSTSPAHTLQEVHQQSESSCLKGTVRWIGSSETFTFCGLRSENVNVSKKLFESLVEIEARGRVQLSPILSPNSSRTNKLNA